MGGLFHGDAIRVVPDGIRMFGSTNLQAAEQVAQAGSVDLHANVTALSPAMGLIGADFLAAFVAAQSEHTRAVTQLSLAYASNGWACHQAAAGYELTDAGTSAALGAAGGHQP